MTAAGGTAAVPASQVEQRLLAAGLRLPMVHAQGAYAVAVRHECTVMVAGQLSRTEHGVISGVATGPHDLADACRACEAAALRAIAAVRSVANLDEVTQALFMRGFIASTPAFTAHTQALDAASRILHTAFGLLAGRHARSALGVAALPSGGLAEIELVVAVQPAAAGRSPASAHPC